MTEYLNFECGPSSGDPERYWIYDNSGSKHVAAGVSKEYALLICHAVNHVLGEPEGPEGEDSD
jgi:hypothetical protein